MCYLLRRKSDYLTREPPVTCCGNCRKPLYAPLYGDDGQLVLECIGCKDTDEEIASYREQTDMAYIISRITAGDTTVLPDPDALYADVTDLPNTPIGMVNFLDGLRRQFDSLPAEARAQYDNSFSRYVAGVPVPQPDVPIAPPVDVQKPEEVLQT